MSTTGIGARRSRSVGEALERVEKQAPAPRQVPQIFRRIPEPKAVDGRRPRAARVGGWPPLSSSIVDVNVNVDVNINVDVNVGGLCRCRTGRASQVKMDSGTGMAGSDPCGVAVTTACRQQEPWGR